MIATERAKRPSDFASEPEPKSDSVNCPFCPGNEEMTPLAVAVYTKRGVFSDGAKRVKNWQVRCFPNMYPAMAPDPTPSTREWVAHPARGFHEVVVESPDHQSDPANFDLKDLMKMVEVYKDRYSHYISSKEIEYVSIFKNWGRVAGASLAHTHTQIIAMPLKPPLLLREMDVISSAARCPYCSLIEREASSERLIYENECWILIAPFFSQSPYETWILPKSHVFDLRELSDLQTQKLAQILGDALRRVSELLNDPPYNYMIYQLPDRRYHLNIRIQPVLSKIAGFEKNTGVFINVVSPEQAAFDLRGVWGSKPKSL